MTQTSLRRVFRIVNGGTPTADEQNWSGDVAWATPIDLARHNGSRITDTDRKLTTEGLHSGSRAVSPGSLIVSTRAPIGYVAETTVRMAFNQGCRGLEPILPIDIRFFRYQLGSLSEQLQSRGQGSTFVELSTDALAETMVRVPPLAEQRAIADYLDAETARINALIAKKQQLIHLLEERLAVLVDQELGRGGWQRIPLKRVCAAITVGVVVDPSSYFVEQGVPFIHGTDVRRGWIDQTQLKHLSTESNALLRKSQIRSGDVVAMRVGEPGRAAVVPPELDGSNCASVLILRRGEVLAPQLLAHFLNSRDGRSQIASVQYGAAQGVMNVGDAVGLQVPVPPAQVQQAIERRLAVAEHLLGTLTAAVVRQIDLLLEHRKALITAAVTGEFAVPGAA